MGLRGDQAGGTCLQQDIYCLGSVGWGRLIISMCRPEVDKAIWERAWALPLDDLNDGSHCIVGKKNKAEEQSE